MPLSRKKKTKYKKNKSRVLTNKSEVDLNGVFIECFEATRAYEAEPTQLETYHNVMLYEIRKTTMCETSNKQEISTQLLPTARHKKNHKDRD